MDTHGYLDINRLARQSPWAHGIAHGFALYGGIALLALFVVLACLRCRRRAFGEPRRLAAALWSGLGALAALGLNQPLSHLIGRARPYDVLHHVEVLVPRVHDFSMPSDHATVAGAVAVGLLLTRDRLLAALSFLVALALAFARVYVGAHYPSDVVVGLLFGGAVAGLGYLVAAPILERLVRLVAKSPVHLLVAPHHEPPVDAGPAAQPQVLQASGAVKILGDSALEPRSARTGEPHPPANGAADTLPTARGGGGGGGTGVAGS